MTAAGAMRVFRDALIRWVPYICRATHCTDVTVELDDRDVVVRLQVHDFHHEHRFTVAVVYGSVGTGAIRPHKKVCRFADDVILSTLEAMKQRNETV